MQFGKYSNLNKRLLSKIDNFNYINILIFLLIRKGKKKLAKKIVYNFLIFLKKYFFKYFNQKNEEFDLINFITNIFNLYRPRVNLLVKKVATNKYFLPVYIDLNKSRILIIKWFIESAKKRSEKKLSLALYYEFLDLFFSRGLTLKKLEEYYKIAKDNRPYLKLVTYKKRGRRKLFKRKYGY